MFIFSTKLTKGKIVTLALICASLAIIFIASLPSEAVDASKTVSLKAKTNAQRIDYLESFGWQVSESPAEETTVVIPTDFDETYETYNLLQKTQGFDLSGYKGRKVSRYTYSVKNYPSDKGGDVSATLLVYDGKVIGGDISSTASGGFMHSFIMPAENTSAEYGTAEAASYSVEEILGTLESSGK